MKSAMRKIFRFAVIGVALLAGCGGGGDEITSGWLKINGSSDRVTTDATISASGSSFVPAGSSCQAAGPFSPPGCMCTLGPDARIDWINTTEGSSGTGEMILPAASGGACGPSYVWWHVLDIPLVPGSNVITITASDGRTSGSGTLNVTRN